LVNYFKKWLFFRFKWVLFGLKWGQNYKKMVILENHMEPVPESLYEKEITFQSCWRHRVRPADGSMHSHRHFELVCHVRGSGSSRVKDGGRYTFEEGSVEFYLPNVIHQQNNVTAGEDVCLLFGTRTPPPESWSKRMYFGQLAVPHLEQEFMRLAEVHPEMSTLETQVTGARVKSLLLQLFYENQRSVTAARGRHRQYAEQAHAYIRARCHTIESMEQVAEKIGISYDYLRHVFREKYQMSLKQYLGRMRIERARNMLIHSSLPLKEIARLSGFENERYFSTCFRLQCGMPPGQYRQKHCMTRLLA
jgi:AraC-like DNA-binding protein